MLEMLAEQIELANTEEENPFQPDENPFQPDEVTETPQNELFVVDEDEEGDSDIDIDN